MINGKHYPMWSQFIERKNEWIGGELVDEGDDFDKAMGYKPHTTKIIDITLEPNGTDNAFFSIVGETFTCGFDCTVGGISGRQVGDGWLVFSGYDEHIFKIKKAISK